MSSDQFLIFAGSLILSVIIFYIITQWAHQIHKRNRYLEAQIKLLSKIAEKQGVSADEIDGIKRMAEAKYQLL